MRVLILAAGYGTRLYPLTKTTAKPLVAINGKLMINFLIEKIVRLKKSYQITELRVVVNNKFYKDFVVWNKKNKIKVSILNDGSNSPGDRLGAIKDMKFGIDGAKSDWLILGGDNLFEDDLKGFISFALKNKPYPAIGLYDVGSKKEASRCGVVGLNTRKRIVKFQEKPKRPFSTLVASCVYFFPRKSLKLLDSYVRNHENVDASGKYIEWLSKESKVFGYLLKGNWIDIGHSDSLKLAAKEFK
tara:strand:+ start:1129 stop:1860 length:732 start_codon:yes stop_codon:yes gene_type:complete